MSVAIVYAQRVRPELDLEDTPSPSLDSPVLQYLMFGLCVLSLILGAIFLLIDKFRPYLIANFGRGYWAHGKTWAVCQIEDFKHLQEMFELNKNSDPWKPNTWIDVTPFAIEHNIQSLERGDTYKVLKYCKEDSCFKIQTIKTQQVLFIQEDSLYKGSSPIKTLANEYKITGK